MKKGVLYIMLSAVCWGLLPLISRLLFLQGYSGLSVPAVRCFLTCIFFAAWGIKTGSFQKIHLKDLPYFACNGIFAIFGTYYFYSLAIERLSMAVASVLLYTAPAFVILFSRLIYKERITQGKAIALGCTLVGLVLVTGVYDPTAISGDALGIVYGLLAGLSYSMLSIFGRKGLTLYDSRINTIVPTLCTGVAFLTLCPPWQIAMPTASGAVLFLLLAVVGSVIPYTAYLKGMSLGVEGGNASVIATLEPIVASLVGVCFLGDAITWVAGLGIVVMLAGIVLAAKSPA